MNPNTAALPTPASVIPSRRAYSVDEARALLGGISRASIYELLQSGELPSIKVAGRRLVPSDGIDSLIASKLQAA